MIFGARQALPHAEFGSFYHVLDFYRRQFQIERAGVDHCQIENVVDDVEKHLARCLDVVQIIALLGVQRPGHRLGQKVRKADNGRKRRAQLIGDVAEERGLQAIGGFQGLITLQQHFLKPLAVGHVGEGKKGAAIGQRRHSIGEMRFVAPGDCAAERVPRVRHSGDRFSQRVPEVRIGGQFLGRRFDPLKMRRAV